MFCEEFEAASTQAFSISAEIPQDIKSFILRERQFACFSHFKTTLAWFDSRIEELQETIEERQSNEETK